LYPDLKIGVLRRECIKKTRILALLILAAAWLPIGGLSAQTSPKIYWGDSGPKGWNGSWPAKFLTVAEKTNFERTADSPQVLEFLDVLRWSSDKVTVLNMFTTPLRRTGTAGGPPRTARLRFRQALPRRSPQGGIR
jgi:hypothetical protein